MATPATLTPAEFGQLLDLAANAQVPLGVAFKMHAMIQRAQSLAASQYSIGEIVPEVTEIPILSEFDPELCGGP